MAEYAWKRGLADGRARDEHAARLLQERRAGVRQALHAARRPDRRARELRDRRQQRPDGGRPAERADADVIVTSTAFGELPALVSGAPRARQRDADPQLLGRRRDVLGAEEPAGDELLRGHLRVGVRRRPEPGRPEDALAKTAGRPPHGRLRPGRGHDRRRRRAIKRAKGSTNGAALATQLEKFEGVPTLGRQRQLLEAAAHVFGRQYRVIAIQNNKGKSSGSVTGEGRPEDLRRDRGDERPGGGEEARRRSGPPPSRARSRACRAL